MPQARAEEERGRSPPHLTARWDHPPHTGCEVPLWPLGRLSGPMAAPGQSTQVGSGPAHTNVGRAWRLSSRRPGWFESTERPQNHRVPSTHFCPLPGTRSRPWFPQGKNLRGSSRMEHLLRANSIKQRNQNKSKFSYYRPQVPLVFEEADTKTVHH